MSAPLEFLAGESCDFAVVRALCAGNYDGLAEEEDLVTQVQGKRMPNTSVVVPSGHVHICRDGARIA